MICKYCGSERTTKDGNHNGMQRYRCMECKKRFDEGKYEDNYFFHFDTKLKKTDRNILTRENYCVPTNKMCSSEKKLIREINEKYKDTSNAYYQCYLTIPNEFFADYEHYTDEWVKKHYENCMENYDLNMNYFNHLDSGDFEKILDLYVKKNRFIEVNTLNDLRGSGIYILVLDRYKQVYIGASDNIRKRILNHWSVRKDFDRLIFGGVESSVLSIDSFGALDTTRIFYKSVSGTYSELYSFEEKYINRFDKRYLLNRVAGGINGEDNSSLRDLKLISSIRKREMR